MRATSAIAASAARRAADPSALWMSTSFSAAIARKRKRCSATLERAADRHDAVVRAQRIAAGAAGAPLPQPRGIVHVSGGRFDHEAAVQLEDGAQAGREAAEGGEALVARQHLWLRH